MLHRLAPLLAALVLTPALATEPVTVRILTPTWRDIVSGVTPIEVELTGSEVDQVREVVLSVDEHTVAELTAPPFQADHDFGQDLGAHRVQALARLGDGREFVVEVTTRKFLANQVEEVTLVNLFVTVRDKGDQIVRGLGKGDFAVYEDGTQQTLERFTDERRPLSVGLVLDTSLTMKGEKLETAREAAEGFLEVLDPKDRVLVVSFSEEIEVLQDLDRDIDGARRALRGLEAHGGTALYDAIYRTADALAAVPAQERRVMVLLSDGRDESASGLEPGSFHTLDEAMNHVLKREVIVFAVGLGKNLDEQRDFYGRQTLADILHGLADSTGGQAYFVRRAGRLEHAYGLIGETLRHQYSMAYGSTNERRDGAWREIRLLVRNPDLKVTARKGYFAN